MTLLEISKLYADAAHELYLAHQYEDDVHTALLSDFDSLDKYEAHLDYCAFMCRQSKEKADELLEQANAARLSLTQKALAA